METDQTRIALLEQRVEWLEKNTVSKDTFRATQLISYGLVSLFMTAIAMKLVGIALT